MTGRGGGGPGTVAIVDGSHCNGRDASGCAAQSPRQVVVGSDPVGAAVDPRTRSAYVTNANDDTVSVIDVSTCNAAHASSCQDRPRTIAVDGTPVLPVVDRPRHTLYSVETVDNDVAVLSDRACSARVFHGCRHPAPTAGAGSFPDAAGTDERYQTVYVGDLEGFEAPSAVSMIDAAACNAAHPSGCARSPRSFQTPDPPFNIAVNQRTDSVYVATAGPLELIDAASCNATTSSGCGPAASVPAGGGAVAVDDSTDTVYALNERPDGSRYVGVIDGRHCHAGDTSGCSTQTADTIPTVAVSGIASLALDAPAHTLYVTSVAHHAVSVVDTRHCHAGDTSGCAGQTPPEVPVPDATGPLAIGVDHATSTAYVTDNFPFSPGAVSMIDTRHCRAADTSACPGLTPYTIPAPAGIGSAVRIDPATDTVYIANLNDSSVSILHARHCNAVDQSGCGRIGKVQVGSNPSDLALDPARRTVFAPNFYDDDASVFAMF